MVLRTPAHRYDSYRSGSFQSAANRPRFDTDSAPKRARHSRKRPWFRPSRRTLRVTPEQWERRQWPRTEAEIYLLRSAMFTAQAMARDMAAAGRGEEIAEIARNISKIAPELPPDSSDDTDESG